MEQAIRLEPREWVPNNQRFPVIVYRGALAGRNRAEGFEQLFRANGWGGLWRNGVYDFHHYHSTAHEILGIAEGQARLMIGGPGGKDIEVKAGDALLLPAGTGHCRLEASGDFLVIGGYPPDQEADLCREIPSAEQKARIEKLGVPATDPLKGKAGGLRSLWSDSTDIR
ncbi:cupin domain-containing protein [Rhizobium tropici]|uniref:Cupin n=1 Tax=Rhizobium tropici TaxID=398 RepID=A0A329Y253_RHITR|nr:cupin domain-containing protein [Rhizobium tropici]RAX37503.1 cupin [Rhizobium tropici]